MYIYHIYNVYYRERKREKKRTPCLQKEAPFTRAEESLCRPSGANPEHIPASAIPFIFNGGVYSLMSASQ